MESMDYIATPALDDSSQSQKVNNQLQVLTCGGMKHSMYMIVIWALVCSSTF